MLRAMFNGGLEIVKDPEGWVFIDRSGKHFDKILNFLRDGRIPLPSSVLELKELLAEAEFYQISELISFLQEAITKNNNMESLIDSTRHLCFSYTMTNKQALCILASTSRKVVILQIDLNISSINNYKQYALFSIIKNLNLFNNLARKYGNKVLFIKVPMDIMCKWTFYAKGQAVACLDCDIKPASTKNPNYTTKGEEIKYYKTRIFKIMTDFIFNDNDTAINTTDTDDEKDLQNYINKHGK
jgi:BTB/POZ domain-containing adapter for CUL3-mediated RhoA degradation protein